jgi:type I restriction enzyme S subunit
MSDHFIDDWRTGSLTDFTVFIRDGTHGTHTRYESGIPLLSAKNITANGRVYWDCEDSFISEEDYKKIHSKYEIKPNDLLITIVGTIGRCALVNEIKERFTVQRSIAIIRPNEEFLLPTYLYQLARGNTFQKQLQLRSNSTAQAGVYLGELANFQLTIPSLEEQQKIASILSSVDEVIENIQAQIAKLEDLKKATMNELLTKGIGHTEFKETEIGRIPKSWNIKPLAKATKKIGDGIHSTPIYTEGTSIAFINGNNLKNDAIETNNQTKTVSEIEFSKHNIGIPKNTVLLSINGTIGNSAIYRGEKVVLGKSVCYLVPEASIHHNFLLLTIQSTRVLNFFKREVTGTTIANLSLRSIKETQIVLPPIDEQIKIANTVDTIKNQIATSNKKIQSLKRLKKSLMQDLLTGKVRVKVES